MADPDRPSRHPVHVLMNQFHGALEGLRDLLSVIVPRLMEEEAERSKFETLASKAGLAEPALQEAVALWETATEDRLKDRKARDEAAETDSGAAEEVSEEAEEPEEPELPQEFIRRIAAIESMFAPRVHDFLRQQGALAAFVHHFNRENTKPWNIETIHRSVITMAVGSFEALISGLVSIQLHQHPETLGGQEPEFSLQELIRLGNLEDAIDEAIERRAERFLYGGFDSWADTFGKKFKIDWSDLALDWDATREVIQRRHIIVHNGSRVSRQYLERVPEGYNDVPLGRELLHPPEYVANALSALTVLGDCVAAYAWAKSDKDQVSAASAALLEKSFDLLVSRRYPAAHKVAQAGCTLGADADISMSLQCNAWIARKQTEGTVAVVQEVSAWDTSAARLKFQVAKAALVDDFDSLDTLLPAAIRSGELDLEVVKFWPLFQEYRDQAAFLDLLQQFESHQSEQ